VDLNAQHHLVFSVLMADVKNRVRQQILHQRQGISARSVITAFIPQELVKTGSSAPRHLAFTVPLVNVNVRPQAVMLVRNATTVSIPKKPVKMDLCVKLQKDCLERPESALETKSQDGPTNYITKRPSMCLFVFFPPHDYLGDQ
jgi:hypothetical protein